jgi:hypoxanthine phosphoribosyltransferase
LQQLCEKLAERTKKYEPEILVGISRGGLVPVRLLSDLLGVKEVAIIRIEFYKSMKETHGYPKITQGLQNEVKGKRVLLVDDVSDSGRSLLVAKEYLHLKGAAEVKVATLHYKPHSHFKPNYYLEETSQWIAYPWETHEIERELKELERTKKESKHAATRKRSG